MLVKGNLSCKFSSSARLVGNLIFKMQRILLQSVKGLAYPHNRIHSVICNLKVNVTLLKVVFRKKEKAHTSKVQRLVKS